mgnify:CR=1 FL=1
MENYFTSSYEISSFVGALNLLLRGAHAVLQHPTLNNGINVKIPPTKMNKNSPLRIPSTKIIPPNIRRRIRLKFQFDKICIFNYPIYLRNRNTHDIYQLLNEIPENLFITLPFWDFL